jgi:hypothetical protein
MNIVKTIAASLSLAALAAAPAFADQTATEAESATPKDEAADSAMPEGETVKKPATPAEEERTTEGGDREAKAPTGSVAESSG